MWTNNLRRSYFIFVRIKIKGKGLTIPVFLPVLEITLDAAADLAWIWEKTTGVFLGKVLSQPQISRNHKAFLKDFHPSQAIALCREFVSELRRLGRWPVVEVNTGDVEISIYLY